MENAILAYRDKLSQIISKKQEINTLAEQIKEAEYSVKNSLEKKRRESKDPYHGTLNQGNLEDWNPEDYIEELLAEIFGDCYSPWAPFFGENID
jgi:hypothetical protein